MKKKKVALIGKGKWGTILKKKLNKISKLVYVLGKNYKKKNYDNIKWVFIATPDITHEKIINFFLKKKINIFCEKPLVRSYNKAITILNKSNKINKKIYISDVLIYLKKKIHLKKNNIILRSKKGNYNLNEILYRLAYHDFYFCYKYLKRGKIKIFKKYKSGKLELIIKNKYSYFNFIYDLRKNRKQHLYNNENISNKQDPLKNMLITILYRKPNFTENHKRNLFALKLIEKIKL